MRYLVSYELDPSSQVDHDVILAHLIDRGAKQILKTTWVLERENGTSAQEIVDGLCDLGGSSLRVIVSEAPALATYRTRTTPPAGLKVI